MALSNMQIFNSYAYSGASETIKQQVGLFNGASANTIVLTSGENVGDYDFDTLFSAVGNIVINRDATASGSLTPVDLEQLKSASVKVGGGTQLMRVTDTQFKWINQDPEQAGMAFGVQVAQGMLAYMLNSAIASFVAATEAQSAIYTDATGGKASLASLNSGASKFGDRSSSIAAWVMHSTSLHDIFGANLVNAQNLFTFGTVRIVDDGFGRPLIMTDSPHLVDVDGGGTGTNHYYQLGLVQGALLLEDNGTYEVYDDKDISKVNVERTMKAEFDFNLGLKGYTWDTASGGASPSDADLATATNWDKVATDVKDLAGVLVKTL
jgi:hypothetical protein